MSKITLHDAGLSPFAQKVKMALIEKKLDFTQKLSDLSEPDADLKGASPRAEIPALEDGDIKIFESTIIVEYLEDKYPEEALLPADPAERARVRMIEEICDSRLEAIVFGVTEIIAFKRADADLAERILLQGKADVAQILDWLEAELGDREWFTGDRFGFGDIAVLPYLQTLKLYKMGPREGSRLATWFERASAKPSFQRCVSDAKAEVASFKESLQKIKTGKWPRQYRDHRLDWFMRAGGTQIVLDGLEDGSIRLSDLNFRERAAL